MDTSISKALIMVASLLLAMIVIAFMTYTFNRTSTWAEAQDQQKLSEQIQQFNKEYEAYDKKLMYGMDVISCLNKVLSNNEKITNESVVNGEKYDVTYKVDASVTINKTLQESLTVYYREKDGTREKEAYTDEFGTLSDDKFEKITQISNKFDKTAKLKTQTEDSEIENGVYALTYDWKETNNDDDDEGKLRRQLKSSNELSITIKNTGTLDEDDDGKVWTKVIYRTPLYDLKTRKFKCSNIEYNSDTGRICKIEFEEI